MSNLEASDVQRPLTAATHAKLDALEAFSSIASTNTYLLAKPAPAPGRFRVALADHQTSGRGRHYRRWLSPRGGGLYLSMSYTFGRMPQHLPALTLALGVGVVDALRTLKIEGVNLKWPNDIVALDGKLGGILTEVQSGVGTGVTVVAGIGLNTQLNDSGDTGAESDWAHRAVDLRSIVANAPGRDVLAGTLVEQLFATFVRYEALGFADFVAAWRTLDWLRGREVTVELPDRQVTGTAAGVDVDGALLIENAHGRTRVITGSIVMAGRG
jgi:BirA family transcriptional regulator, biotin operon repressor / biotin---[acetyl-CoA-carboxylase] ligase